MSQEAVMNIIATFVVVGSCGWFGWSWLMQCIKQRDERRDREQKVYEEGKRQQGTFFVLVITNEQVREEQE